MPLKPFLSSLCLLTLLVGCNDISSNHQKGENRAERTTPSIESNEDSRSNLRSAIHREKGSQVLSYAQEISQTLAMTLPDTLYRIIPLMEKDDEGSDLNVTTVDTRGRPIDPCGLGDTFSGINDRIKDCQTKNFGKATWEGFVNGSAGEGRWELVSLAADGTEIWLDGRTGMVWSDIIKKTNGANSFNWCAASGNTQNDTETEVIDCNALNDFAGDEGLCVGAVTPGIGNQIKWRLPTRNDFLQADLDGSRLVLKLDNSQGVWTATMRAGVIGRTEAWVYNAQDGTLFGGNLTSQRQVRCIGAPLR